MDDDRRCTATSKRSGERCGRAAITGGTVCAFHGGKASQVQAAAERRVIETKVVAAVDRLDLTNPPESDPALALLREVDRAVAAVDWLAARLAEIEPADESFAATLSALAGWSDRAARVSAEVARIGIAQHRVLLDEQQVDGVVRVIEGALVELGVSPRARDVRSIVARHLRALDESAAS